MNKEFKFRGKKYKWSLENMDNRLFLVGVAGAGLTFTAMFWASMVMIVGCLG